ncbi:MAG: T9SS type A sorting domain-containing protein [Bacteroidales bacterium]|nr:T9SS type A sorting domain-containing protein [Bacteroidales bacterium]
MKKVLTLFFIMILALNVKAQCPITEAVDFYSIDDYGTKVHLFEILDGGQYAFIYFFMSDASTSEMFDPCVADAYRQLGSNQEDVYFIGVAPCNDSLAIDGWKEKYDIDFPVIHWYTEGSTAVEICDDYQVQIFSTAILIAPDRQILIDNIWPITSTDVILDAIAEFVVPGDNVNEIVKNSVGIHPNPAKTNFNIDLDGDTHVRIFDIAGRCVKEIDVVDNATINIEDLNKGVYFVEVNDKIEKLIVE